MMVRWFGLLSLPAVVVTSVSFVRAVDASNTLSVTERAVEWLRDHHYGDAVSFVERIYYEHHQPPVGGTLAGGLPTAPVVEPSTPTGPARGTAAAPVPGPTPVAGPTVTVADGIEPFVADPLPGEGAWEPLGEPVGGLAALQVAYLRPDAEHGSVLAAVVRIDQTLARLRLVAGTTEPGPGPWPAGARLTADDTASMLAAFNSGFRLGDARGGVLIAGRTAGSLRDGAATLAVSSDGTATIGQWGRDLTAGPTITAARQNLDLIVDGGKVVGGLDSNAGDRWGRTVGNRLFVWRSGIGIDARGRLLYAASGGLSVSTLAGVLQRAGAVRAMELDINYAWVSFNVFGHDSGRPVGTKLLKEMKKSASRYLAPDARDFFAVLPRPAHGA